MTDVNERPQFADDAATTIEVAEDIATGTDIGNRYEATDPENDTLTYSLSGADSDLFQVDVNGQLQLKGALDHEDKSGLTVIIQVTDSEDSTGATETPTVTIDDTHTVTITVTNVFEAPRFDEEYPQGETTLTREIAENTAAGQPVGTPVSATDDDGDTVTYSLDDQDGANFEIDSSGQIKTKNELDYETTQSYSVTVSITDSKDDAGNAENPAVEDATVDVTINVTDVNEGPAFAADAATTLSVDENTATDTDITDGLFTATDPESDTLTYSLGGTDAASFAIDANGQLKTKADLDHETKDSFSVTIQVTDGKADDGTTDATIDDTHAVTINVTDLDEAGTISFNPETPAAANSITATLQDDDTPVSNQVWQWHISSDQNTWTPISGADSNSYTPGSVDIGKYLRGNVIYTDSFGANKNAQAETDAVLSAPITNKQPSFDAATATRSVAENTPANQNIGAPVSATHPDSVGTLVYSLGGTDVASFDIDTSTGQLKTKTVFDYETDAKISYTVTVSVTDGLDDHSLSDTVVDGTITVTINVTDENEPPVFDGSPPTELSVVEGTPTGTDITDGLFTATDPDAGDTVTYSLDTVDGASFEIDSTGQIRTKLDLDHEAKETYTVTVSVTDSGSLLDTHTVTINVTNVFEAPRFDDDDGTGTATRTVPENTEAGQPVGDPVSATDDEDDTLTYSLDGTGAESFDIDSGTGQIKTLAALDHEAKDSYSVTVSVSDGKADDGTTEDPPENDTTIDVTIEVEDVNEKPAFDGTPLTELEIAENTAAGHGHRMPHSPPPTRTTATR